MLATVTGVPNVPPPSNEAATLIAALVDAPGLNVGPNCQATYTSPLGPMAGTELCCEVPVKPQLALVGSVMNVTSGLTITGPCQMSPASWVRHTSIWPKPNCAKPHTSLKLVSETYAAPLPSLAAAIASLS